jgi:hypothetical protein
MKFGHGTQALIPINMTNRRGAQCYDHVNEGQFNAILESGTQQFTQCSIPEKAER